MSDETAVEAGYWHKIEDGRIQCDLCPRECKLRRGQSGACFVRTCDGERIRLQTYGRSSGFCIDPIEKKPLNHFYPGSTVLSFGTIGCNLACRFCQNWDISKAKEMDRLLERASPEDIADAALSRSCLSVAFTYNDPVIFLEYAMDVADCCHEKGIKTVAVTAGYMNDPARCDFYSKIDAANVDLKSFSDRFYHDYCKGRLQPVLDTLLHIKRKTDVWLEITTLIIPGANDTDEEISALSKWVANELGSDVPLHFSAFHPAYKAQDIPRTPLTSLERAREIALQSGLVHVYTGNVHHIEGGTTHCAKCHQPLIVRDWFQVKEYKLKDGRCPDCGTALAGRF